MVMEPTNSPVTLVLLDTWLQKVRKRVEKRIPNCCLYCTFHGCKVGLTQVGLPKTTHVFIISIQFTQLQLPLHSICFRFGNKVALEQPYNERCDCYSFSILMWQILAMMTPYEGYTISMFEKKVVHGGTRPKCDEKWPEVLSNLMRRGWGPLSQRPAMSEMSDCLRDEINRVSDSEVQDIIDISRKSEMSKHAKEFAA